MVKDDAGIGTKADVGTGEGVGQVCQWCRQGRTGPLGRARRQRRRVNARALGSDRESLLHLIDSLLDSVEVEFDG